MHESNEAVSKLPGIGPKTVAMLAGIGITTKADLQKTGAIAAYIAIQHNQSQNGQSGVSLNLLYALVGALEGIHWQQIARSQRTSLIMALDDYHLLAPPPDAGLPNKTSDH